MSENVKSLVSHLRSEKDCQDAIERIVSMVAAGVISQDAGDQALAAIEVKKNEISKKKPAEIDDTDSDYSSTSSPLSTPRRADNPEKGHARPMPGDMTGQDPSSSLIAGDLPPAIAAMRQEIEDASNRIVPFVEKYGEFAFQKLGKYGIWKDTQGVYQRGRGSEERVLDKDQAVKDLQSLSNASSEEIMQRMAPLGNFLFRIARGFDEVSKAHIKKTAERTRDMPREQRRGEAAKIAKILKDFSDMRELAAADFRVIQAMTGKIKTSSGKGSRADQTFLQKKAKFGKPPEVSLKDPSSALKGKFAVAAGDYSPPEKSSKGTPKKLRPGERSTAKMPTIHRKSRELTPDQIADLEKDMADWEKDEGRIHEHFAVRFDRYMDLVIEQATADFSPMWWDDL